MSFPLLSSIHGCLLGTAIGDALGLPYEKLDTARARKLLGAPDCMRLCFGRGFCSDDTEHALFTAAALSASNGDPAAFERELARQFKWWMLSLPAGIGLATLKAGCRIWFTGRKKSGVFSAGNGPAMRGPILGACARTEDELLEWNAISTRLTHTDPKAEAGSYAIALATFADKSAWTIPQYREAFSRAAATRDPAWAEMSTLLDEVIESAPHQTLAEYCAAKNWKHGISGYILHTAPAVLHTWLRYRDKDPSTFAPALQELIEAGGDTDTTAAILGGLLGARWGAQAIPPSLSAALAEWPRDLRFIEATAKVLKTSLESGHPVKPPTAPLPVVWSRNAVFVVIVLTHAFRRLLPF